MNMNIGLVYEGTNDQLVFLQPTSGQDITSDWMPLTGLIYSLWVSSRSLLEVKGHVAIKHTQKSHQTTMIGVQLTNGGKRVPGFLVTTNVDDDRHYEDIALNGYVVLDPGLHVIAVEARLLMNVDGSLRTKSSKYSGIWLKLTELD